MEKEEEWQFHFGVSAQLSTAISHVHKLSASLFVFIQETKIQRLSIDP